MRRSSQHTQKQNTTFSPLTGDHRRLTSPWYTENKHKCHHHVVKWRLLYLDTYTHIYTYTYIFTSSNILSRSLYFCYAPGLLHLNSWKFKTDNVCIIILCYIMICIYQHSANPKHFHIFFVMQCNFTFSLFTQIWLYYNNINLSHSMQLVRNLMKI